MPLLEIEELWSGYGDLDVLHGISVNVNRGEMVSIVGPNGAGKTALLRTISGLIQPTSGRITFDGQPLNGLPPHDIVEMGVIHILEGRQLFKFLTVEQNLRVGSTIGRARPHRDKNFDLVYSLFPRLYERRDQVAGTMSGGEQQMVATARALMTNPELLMLDEPSWGLAPMLVNELFEVIAQVRESVSLSILLIEQNVQKALSLADRAYVLERGHIVSEGLGKELLEQEDLKKAYLGL